MHVNLGPARPHTVEDQVQYFETKFGKLIDKTCGEVKGNIEPHIFLSRVTYLPVSAHPQHRSFIEEKLSKILPPVTFENVYSEPLLGLFELWTLGTCYQSMWKCRLETTDAELRS